MKVQNSHYSSFLISVHFERGFMSDTLIGKIEQALNFLNDLGNLARKHGHRLHATYSINGDNYGYHAHFAVSWLSLSSGYLKTAQNGNKRISRKPIIDLLESNYFVVDNPLEAIKTITHDKKFVTNYVIRQPKENQTVLFYGFYKQDNIDPIHSEEVSHSYSSTAFFDVFGKRQQRPHITTIVLFILISCLEIFMIRDILLSLF